MSRCALEGLGESKCGTVGLSNLTTRLLNSLVSHKARSNKVPRVPRPKPKSRDAACSRPGSGQSAGQRGHPGRERPVQPRLLQSAVLSEESERYLETHYRPVSIEQTYKAPKVQDGNCGVNPEVSISRNVGGISRSKGCLLSRTDETIKLQVLEVHEQGSCVRIQGTALRTLHSTPNIHTSHGTSKTVSGQIGCGSQYVPGRLANISSQSISSPGGSCHHPKVMPEARSQGKLYKVRISTNEDIQVCGVPLPLSGGKSDDPCRPGAKDTFCGSSIAGAEERISARSHEDSRSIGFGREDDPVRKVSFKGPPVQFEPILEKGAKVFKSNYFDPTVQTSLVLVGERLRFTKSAPAPPPDPGDCLHGQFTAGLGCASGQGGSVRKVVAERITPTHKHLGDEGSDQVTKGPSTPFKGQNSTSNVRQHHGGVVHQKTGGDKVPQPVARNQSPVGMVLRSRHRLKVEPHKGRVKRKGRPSLTHWADSASRVVAEQANVSFDLPNEYILARNRLVCHKQKQPTGDLCVSDVGSGSLGRGRDVPELVQPSVLCIPPNSNVGGGIEQVKERDKLPCPAGSPSMGTGTVLSTANAVKHRTPNKVEVPRAARSANPTREKAPRRQYTQASRLEFVRRSIKAKGFSKRASECITAAVRPSTSGVYDRKWLVFSRWCRGRKIPPTKAYVSDIADFLISLQDRGRAPVTVEGYRTAISETFKFSDRPSVAEDPCIKAIIRSHRISHVAKGNTVPPWDLAVVLKHLSTSPYEPIELCSMKLLTVKTLFLLALASGKRGGELSALTREGFSWNNSKTAVTLRFDPAFVSKTQGKTGKSISPIILPSIGEFVGNEPEEMVLCPVRALLKYYFRSRKLGLVTKRKKKFFVSYQSGRASDICSETISRWMKWLIIDSHQKVLAKDLTLSGVKAHQVRGVSTSNAFAHSSMEQVLEMGSWSTDTTFTNFYLKDLSQQNERGYTLAPMITGNVISRI